MDVGYKLCETGKRRPKRVHLERIAEVLGICYEATADYGVVTANEGVHSLMRILRGSRLRP